MARLALISLVAFAMMALAAAPAGVAQKGKPKAPVGFELQILYESFKLGANEKIDIFEVTCPTGWAPVAGGLESDPEKTDVSGSEPSRIPGVWMFDLQSKSGDETIVTLWVACQRPKVIPNPAKKTVLLKRRYVVAPFELRKLRPRCGSKKKSLGFGWSLLGPNAQPLKQGVRAAGAEDGARIAGVVPTAQGHDVTIAAGSQPVDATLTEVCAPETVTVRGGGERRVSIDRERVTGSVAPGLSTLSASCGRGRIPLGGPGFSTPPEVTIAPSLGPDAGARLRASNPTAGALPVTMVVPCTRGRLVGFRRTGVTVDTTTGPVTITPGT